MPIRPSKVVVVVGRSSVVVVVVRLGKEKSTLKVGGFQSRKVGLGRGSCAKSATVEGQR